MGQSDNLHPFGSAIPPHGLSSLQQVLNLCELRIRVRFVDERVELFHRIPDRHAATLLRAKGNARLDVERDGLLFMLLLLDVVRSGVGGIVGDGVQRHTA